MNKLRSAERKKAKIKLGIQSPSGGGKTYSSLLIAKGLTNGNLEKVAIIDTENGSADLYSHIGKYNVLTLTPPFTPEKYIEAISVCEEAGMEVIILDSTSHEWENLLESHSQMQGNSFTNWAKITPRHKAFIDKILQTNAHIICTMRSKSDYVLNQKDGKFIPEKVGLKSVQREGLDFEMTIVFDIDLRHHATCSKDRTGLFMDKPEFVITDKTGESILAWCNGGAETTIDEVRQKIKSCDNIEGLKSIYSLYSEWRDQLKPVFTARKKEIEFLKNLESPKHISANGSPSSAKQQ